MFWVERIRFVRIFWSWSWLIKLLRSCVSRWSWSSGGIRSFWRRFASTVLLRFLFWRFAVSLFVLSLVWTRTFFRCFLIIILAVVVC